ncbi:alpha/beta fold hydrolase [Cellulomonas carbonis]|uniref:Alpha/beta hydrolase n=1 Tax=Cellulomonas carbonis T26 TaxID=947969 RepID=A0A0A0BQW7_9CELL|nr:alpha/beta fold hydrolase [Cellulomonas carbonis]KGM10361.1 alpha/beta hydrolase [Cellulomonas carbonis T26]
MHGVRTSSAIWTEQVAEMSRAGHHCVTVDLPGHGTRADERFTLESAHAAIDEAVEACATPPLLVGMSLGGYSSLSYAARFQHKLAGVLLAGCSTEVRGKPLSVYRHLAARAVRAFRPSASASWHVVTDMLHALRGHSFLRDLRVVHLPVWFVNGARDPLRLDERRFVAAHPAARLTVVPRAGHDVNLHAPLEFNRLLGEAVRALRHPHVPAALRPQHAHRTPAAVL